MEFQFLRGLTWLNPKSHSGNWQRVWGCHPPMPLPRMNKVNPDTATAFPEPVKDWMVSHQLQTYANRIMGWTHCNCFFIFWHFLSTIFVGAKQLPAFVEEQYIFQFRRTHFQNGFSPCFWLTLWLFNIAMENPRTKWWFQAGKIIYFYGPSIPWRTVSHNRRVNHSWVTWPEGISHS